MIRNDFMLSQFVSIWESVVFCLLRTTQIFCMFLQNSIVTCKLNLLFTGFWLIERTSQLTQDLTQRFACQKGIEFRVPFIGEDFSAEKLNPFGALCRIKSIEN